MSLKTYRSRCKTDLKGEIMAKVVKKSAAAKEVKKEVKPAKVKMPEKFTVSTLCQYIADKNGISKKQAKEIIDDVFEFIETGVMEGERVPIGKMGKAFVRVRPATKARMGRNPLTGEEIKIAAKKATKVPKFTFGKAFKESALKAKIKTK